ANLLALVATAQPHQDPYYQTSKSHKSYAPTSKASLLTRSHATTRHKGKEIAKPIIPPSESASKEDSDPEQAQKDKEMQKNLALIAKYLKKIYKPTNNNLRTSSNTKNKNVDTTPRYKNDNPTRQFGNHRTMTVVGAKETVGCQVQYDAGYNVFANEIQHSEQPESISNTCAMETGDSNVIPDSPNMCDNDIQNDQNAIQKQLKKANASLTQELTECKSILAKTSRTLGESNSIRDSCLVALQNKQTGFERYKNLNDRTVDYAKLEHKLNETLGLLAQKDIDIKEENLSINHFRAPTAHDMEILIKTCLMPLALKIQNDSFTFVHELKQEMHADLKCVESLEKETDELESDKAEFSNMYDMLLQECVSNDVMCSYLHSLYDLDAHTELECLYLHKVKECDCLTQKLSKQTEYVSKEVYTELLRSFAKLEKHSISLEIALQQYLKAQLQDKNIAISELKKLIEKCKGKSVETMFDKPSVVRQPNAQRIPKPSVLGKPAPFSDSLERKNFAKKKSVPKTNESEGLSKPVTTQNLSQTAREAVRNTNVIKPGMYRIDTRKNTN
ncbi:hypothetical protein Tco_1346233, partial [Tanacetum coccineum]